MKNKRGNALCRPSFQDNLSHKLFSDYSGLQRYRKGLEIANHVTLIFFTGTTKETPCLNLTREGLPCRNKVFLGD